MAVGLLEIQLLEGAGHLPGPVPLREQAEPCPEKT